MLLPNVEIYGLALDGLALTFPFIRSIVKVGSLQAPGTRRNRGCGVGWVWIYIHGVAFVGDMTKLSLGNKLVFCTVLSVIGRLRWQLEETCSGSAFVLALLY